MEVDVEVQGRTEPLDASDGTARAAQDAGSRSAAPVAHLKRARERAVNVAADVVIVGHPIAKAVRDSQHPLTDRHNRQYVLDQTLGEACHALAAARRAEAATLA